jgi:hypothetical protein
MVGSTCVSYSDPASTCLTINVKVGDDMADPGATADLAKFPAAIGMCVEKLGCPQIKALYPNVDMTCADASTSCATGYTCSDSSSGSMAQISMSAVIFSLCAAMYQL